MCSEVSTLDTATVLTYSLVLFLGVSLRAIKFKNSRILFSEVSPLDTATVLTSSLVLFLGVSLRAIKFKKVGF